jgi:prepilin-type N-terminal cleavage/methylation domain-containing protein
MDTKQKGFTLIEILIVIAVIAILAVVVVLSINPSSLFKGQRDSSRVSSLTTITNAVAFAKANGLSLGTPGVPDPTLTGAQTSTCSSLGLPAIPSATYQCVSAANLTKTDGTGWIPITFNTLPGSPLGVLPTDPVNSTSSGEYFIYTTNGSGYETLANAENASDTTNDALTQGTNLALITSFPGNADTTPPSVTITAPIAGSTTPFGQNTTVTANATDNVGVTLVNFYYTNCNSQATPYLFASATTSPYTVTLNTSVLTTGGYILTATAYDAAGNSSTSMSVAFKNGNGFCAP